MNRKNLDWWCERSILLLVCGMLVFAPLAYGAVEPWAFLTILSASLVVLALWLARLWLSLRGKILWPPLTWVVLAFVLYAVARYFTADIEYVARQELIQILLFALLFICIANNLRRAEETEAVTYTLIAVGTVAACYAVAQLLMHSNRVWNEISPYLGRASGPYISPNNLACLLAMLLPLALAFLLVGRVNIFTRIFLGYAALAMAAGLAVTFSRGGWAAAAVGITLVLGILLFHGNHRLRAFLLLVAMILAGSIFVSGYLSKTSGYVARVKKVDERAPDVLDTSSRLIMWQAAAQMWKDNLWFGVGPAHYDYRFREYRPEALQARPDRAHNDYLNLLADWGAVGGVICLTGIGVFIFLFAKNLATRPARGKCFWHGAKQPFCFFPRRHGRAGGVGSAFICGFQFAHSRQRARGRDTAGLGVKQCAFCLGEILGANPAARQSSFHGRHRRRVGLSRGARLAFEPRGTLAGARQKVAVFLHAPRHSFS